MLNEKRLVKYLNTYIGNKDLPWNNRIKILLGSGVPDTELLVYLRDKKRFMASKKFRPFRKLGIQEKEEIKLVETDKIKKCIDDCIHNGYIEAVKENENFTKSLEVTPKGRDFTKLGGFIEEVIKRRKRTTTLLFSSAAVSVVTGLITHFWPDIKNVFS